MIEYFSRHECQQFIKGKPIRFLTASKSFRKTSRGNAEFLIEDGKLIVRWNDNSVVTVVTNMENEYSDVDTQRWNKQKHAMDKVKQPTCIKSYITHMGGVDLHDQCVNRYRIGIRSKKWW